MPRVNEKVAHLPVASGVYLITCQIGPETIGRYVGATANIRGRACNHLHHLRSGTHRSREMQKAFAEHGEGSFWFEVLKLCGIGFMREREMAFMKRIRPEFNTTTPDGEKRTCMVTIPMKLAEIEDLDQRAKAAGMLRTRYARSLITGAKRNSRTAAVAAK